MLNIICCMWYCEDVGLVKHCTVMEVDRIRQRGIKYYL